MDEAFRRQGVSKRLFAATLQAAPARGYEKILTYVRADNPAALSAYAAQGFTVVGVSARHTKLADRYVDEIIIEKLLD